MAILTRFLLKVELRIKHFSFALELVTAVELKPLTNKGHFMRKVFREFYSIFQACSL
jgi:hypothetical protein